MPNTSAFELPRQLTSALSIHRIIELFSPGKRETNPMARLILALNQDTDSTHQSRSTACRYLLQHLLSITSATNKNDWSVHHSTSGAPYLLSHGKPSSLNISLAHSGSWLAAGVAYEAQIGVDIEQFRTRGNFLEITNYLGWKKPVKNVQDFHSKWTLWEANAKCTEGSVLMRKNLGFEQLCDVNTQDQVCNSGIWNGLHGNLDQESFYAIVLKCKHTRNLTHCNLDPGNVEPW